jgi:hypothetical protein
MPKKLVVLLSLTCACFIGCGPKTVEEKAVAVDAEVQAELSLLYDRHGGSGGLMEEFLNIQDVVAAEASGRPLPRSRQFLELDEDVIFARFNQLRIVPADAKEAVKWLRLAEKNLCIKNMRELSGATQQYLMAQKTTNMPPSISPSLDVYFQNPAPTTCPVGGTYTLPATGKGVPTCTLASEGHVLTQ